MSEMLNLDELEEKSITYKGQEYKFPIPPASKMGAFNKIRQLAEGEEDPEKVVAIFAEEVGTLIPEIPKELYSNWNPDQISAFIKFVVGEPDQAKKK